MKEANANRLHILAATCIGIAAAVLAILALVKQPSPVTRDGASPAPSDDQIARLVASMDALNEALVRLEKRMDESYPLPALTPNAGLEVQPDRRELVMPSGEAAPEETEVAAGSSTHWALYLDRDISRALIERGLTPFDPGVAEHVTKAGEALRKAKSEYHREVERLMDDERNDLITRDGGRELIRARIREKDDALKEIIEQLTSALDALHR